MVAFFVNIYSHAFMTKNFYAWMHRNDWVSKFIIKLSLIIIKARFLTFRLGNRRFF